MTHADPTADGKATTAGLKPLLLPSTFSPQLPPTPEAGALPQPGAPHHHHHPVRRSSSSWLRHTNPIHSHSCHSYGGSSSSLASSSSSSLHHHHHHQRQMSMDWSRSPSLSFDSEDSASSSDSLYDASSATTSPSSLCSSTPKPFRAPPARSLSASAASSSSTPTTTTTNSNTHTPTPTPPGSSVLRTSSLSHALSPTSASIITTQGEHTRANRIQRSSISYSKSSFQPLLLRSSSSSSSSSSPQLPLLSHPNPSARHGYSPSLDHLLEVLHPPSRPLTSDLHSDDTLLDKLLDELVQCAHELGLEDELAGIVQF